MKKENAFQASLIRTIKNLLPGCIVLKNDSSYIQGIPDLLVLHGITWAALEVKRYKRAPHQPNQDYYINKMSSMSFAEFIYPENTQQVLEDMVQYFNWVNSRDVTVEQFNELKNREIELSKLISQNNYTIAAA